MKETMKINVETQNKGNKKKLAKKAYIWSWDKAHTSIAFDVKTPRGMKWFAINTTNLLLKHTDFTVKERGYFFDEIRKQRVFWKNKLLRELHKINFDRNEAEFFADLLSLVHFLNPEEAMETAMEYLSRTYPGETIDELETERLLLTATEIVEFYMNEIVEYLVQLNVTDVEHLYKNSLERAEEKYLQACLCKYRYQKFGNSKPIRINITQMTAEAFKKHQGTYYWYYDKFSTYGSYIDDYDYSKDYVICLQPYWMQKVHFCAYWREMWDYYEQNKKGVWLDYTKFLIDELVKFGAEFEKAFATVDEIINWWQSDKRLDYQALKTSSRLRLPMLSHWYLLPDEEEYLYECVKKYRTM